MQFECRHNIVGVIIIIEWKYKSTCFELQNSKTIKILNAVFNNKRLKKSTFQGFVTKTLLFDKTVKKIKTWFEKWSNWTHPHLKKIFGNNSIVLANHTIKTNATSSKKWQKTLEMR